jgi:hypothetical protein
MHAYEPVPPNDEALHRTCSQEASPSFAMGDAKREWEPLPGFAIVTLSWSGMIVVDKALSEAELPEQTAMVFDNRMFCEVR